MEREDNFTAEVQLFVKDLLNLSIFLMVWMLL